MTGMLPQKNFTLVPFDVRERISLAEAAALAGKSESTIRTWCIEHGIGRRVGNGTWAVSCVALQMFLDGDLQAPEDISQRRPAGRGSQKLLHRYGSR